MAALGIDLGTTYSAVARVGAGGRSEVVINRDGEAITPSVVLFQGDEVLVGSMARHSAATAPDDCVQFVKRFMGDPHWTHTDGTGHSRRPEEISALILRRLVEDARDVTGEAFEDVVVTVPAYFDDSRRQATKDAAQLAGLRVLRLLNEPTAAAIAYGLDHSDAGTILVYDLGGGTFDVTVLRRDGDELVALATDGDRNLGGFDFDNALMGLVNRKWQAEGGPDLYEDERLTADLRERCELAKRTLSRAGKASVHLSAGGTNRAVPVTREEFEEVTAALLYRTEVLVESVLAEASLGWDGVDKLLLVGGSTRMPMVRELVVRLAGKEPELGVNPDEAVAIGAGAVAAMEVARTAGGGRATLPEGTVSFQDITSQGLGVVVLQDGVDRNSVIISRNTQVPSQREEVYGTTVPDQRAVNVRVTVGDDEDLDFCSIVHEKPLPLPPGLEEDAPIRVVMSYDIDGLVHLVLSLPGRGRNGADLPLGEIELDRPGNLSDAELQSIRRSVEAVTVA